MRANPARTSSGDGGGVGSTSSYSSIVVVDDRASSLVLVELLVDGDRDVVAPSNSASNSSDSVAAFASSISLRISSTEACGITGSTTAISSSSATTVSASDKRVRPLVRAADHWLPVVVVVDRAERDDPRHRQHR